MRTMAYALLLLLTPAALAAPPDADAKKFTLRNCVNPQLRTTHEIKVTLRRQTRRAGVVEQSAVGVTARCVRAHLDESQPGRVKVADMVITEPPAVLAVLRDKKPVEPPPGPEVFNLPPRGAASLNTRVQSVADGPPFEPVLRPVEEALLTLLLDVAHWPRLSVPVGHHWSRDLRGEAFIGRQSFDLNEAGRLAGEATAVVEMNLEGRFAGRLGEQYEFERGRARFIWARGDRVLLRLEAAARYKRIGARDEDPIDLRVEQVLKNREKLSDDEQAAQRRDLEEFGNVLAEYRAGRLERTLAWCAEYRAARPRSCWLPALTWIESEAQRRQRGGPRLDSEALQKALAELVIRWDAASKADDVDLLARSRSAFEQILDAQAGDVRKLLRSKDDNQRALAVFAWSFGRSPEHYIAVAQAVVDPSPRVRAWAASGLAARGGHDTDPELLRRLTSDDDAEVRARGCLATARCLSGDEPLTGRLREIVRELLFDPEAHVRSAAIAAFAAAGTPADLEILAKARLGESRDAGKSAIDRAVEKIKRRAARDAAG